MKNIRQNNKDCTCNSYNSSSIIASYASSSSIAFISVSNNVSDIITGLLLPHVHISGYMGVISLFNAYVPILNNKKEELHMSNPIKNNVTNNTKGETFTASSALNQKLTREQEETMKAMREKAEAEAQKKAEAEAQKKAEAEAQKKAEGNNPNYDKMFINPDGTIGILPALTGDITTHISELFTDCNLRDNFTCNYGLMEYAAIAHKAKIENKNSILRSYTLIPKQNNAKEIRLTFRRRIVKGEFKFTQLSTVNDNDHEVLLQSQLGKEKIGTSYEEEKERLEKTVNSMLDKLVKFTASHSKVNNIAKNEKEVREIRKAINKLIALIDNNR